MSLLELFLKKLSFTKLCLALCVIVAFTAGLYTAKQLKYDFQTVDGQKFSHDDLRGNTIVVNYFAQWCAPCLREIPELNEFHHQSPKNVQLFAISYDALSEEKLLEIKKKYNIEFPVISRLDTGFGFDKPQYLPATFIIKPNGELAGQLLGEQTLQTLNEAVSVY